MRGYARPAQSMLPVTHWAFTDEVPRFDYNPARAEKLLDEAGHPRGPGAPGSPSGVRFHLTMKASTDEGTRLLAAVLEQQLARVGIALDLRSYEFATFYADVTRGAFQMYSLRWIGGNEQPDIFSYAFSTARFSPKGANRSHYSNARLDSLLDDAAQNPDQARRRELRRGTENSGRRSARNQSLVSRYRDRREQTDHEHRPDSFGQLFIPRNRRTGGVTD